MRALLGLAAVSLIALGPAPVASAVPAKFWGVVPQEIPTEDQFARIKRGGVDSIRIPIFWDVAQYRPDGPLEWNGTDIAVGRAASAGVDVLPFVTGAPSWAVPTGRVPGTQGGIAAAPERLPVAGAARSAWFNFLRLVVQRYGPNGTFWAANPAIPPRPIRTWQIWNEPNFKYFVTHPNPGQYGKLVKISSGAIRSVDPGAKIVLGGLFARPREATWKVKPPQAFFATDFLTKMYKRTPGVRSKFNAIALHPYSSRYQLLRPNIEEVRAVLKANRDLRKRIWITELGWSTQKPDPRRNAFAKGVAGQVRELRGSFSMLRKNQVRWRIGGVYWFSLEDGPEAACNFCSGAGLFASGFVPKPSWTAYARFAGGRP